MIDLIELLYRQHKQLRYAAEMMWNEKFELHLTSSEWYVLKSIAEGKVMVPELMEQLDITKQGVHKFLQALQDKELISTELIQGAKRQKIAHLTPRGQDVMCKSLALDNEISEKVRASIGNEQYEQLISILGKPLISK